MAGTKPVQAGEGKERRHRQQQQQQVGIHHSCRYVKNSHENSKPKNHSRSSPPKNPRLGSNKSIDLPRKSTRDSSPTNFF